jgi:hypothetical protein
MRTAGLPGRLLTSDRVVLAARRGAPDRHSDLVVDVGDRWPGFTVDGKRDRLGGWIKE